jgi:hypothetical protein
MRAAACGQVSGDLEASKFEQGGSYPMHQHPLQCVMEEA